MSEQPAAGCPHCGDTGTIPVNDLSVPCPWCELGHEISARNSVSKENSSNLGTAGPELQWSDIGSFGRRFTQRLREGDAHRVWFGDDMIADVRNKRNSDAVEITFGEIVKLRGHKGAVPHLIVRVRDGVVEVTWRGRANPS